MRIGKILNKLSKKYHNHFFSGICFDSKKCKKNNIFISIKGLKANGNNFIDEAIKKGARTIISDNKFQGFKNKILYIHERNPRLLLSEIACKIYKKKPKNIIAVTGTNGKSSIVDFYVQILNLNKLKSVSIGTLGVKSQTINIKTHNTTPDPITLNKIFEKIYIKKIDNVILEASSHGLSQYRLNGIQFNTGIFTNLSRDHLDYHKNYKNYFNAKLYLFNKLLKKRGNIIFDNDIDEAKALLKIAKDKKFKIYNIGHKSKLKIINHKLLKDSQLIEFKYNNKVYSFKSNLIGKIQIKNLFMAILAANKTLPMNKIVKILHN